VTVVVLFLCKSAVECLQIVLTGHELGRSACEWATPRRADQGPGRALLRPLISQYSAGRRRPSAWV
jgi:hypothetical protein